MHVDDLLNKAINLVDTNKYSKAIKQCQVILLEDALHLPTLNLLGNIFKDTNQYKKSKHCYEIVLKINPNQFECMYNFGGLYYNQKKYEKAAYWWFKALSFMENSPELLNKLGSVCIDLENEDEAILYYKESLKNKNDVNVVLMIGKIYSEKNEYDKALKYYNKALKIDNTIIMTHFNIGLFYLTLKKYKKAWVKYEYRLQLENEKAKYNYLPFPLYKKEQNLNKKVFIFHEQGFGDSIQFIRYIKLLNNRGIKFSIGIQRVLNKLMSYNFPEVKFISKIEEVDKKEYNYSLPIMSIPYVFDIYKFKPLGKYLSVNKKDILKFKKNSIKKNKLNIGIVWQGSKGHVNDINRSINFDFFKELSNLKDVKLYSLQIENIEMLKKTKILNLGKDFKNFYDTAVAIECLDLIISVDTSIVHLCGALGKKCLAMIPFRPDWRWGLDTQTNDWYESVILFRQQNLRDWSNPFEEVRRYVINTRDKFYA